MRLPLPIGSVALFLAFALESHPLLGQPLPAFSSLSIERQAAFRKSVAPPPLAQCRNPYSTPMYYRMWGSDSPDGKAHPEWQEALIKDWAELGMTRLHFYAYPQANGSSNRNYTITEAERAGIAGFMLTCQENGMKLGLRVDLPVNADHSSGRSVPDYWVAHPDNPDNELKPWFGWLSEMVTLMKGRLDYLILGDEIEWKLGTPKGWNAEVYMKFFTQAAEIVHRADPALKISMYSTSPSRWREVLGLLDAGYAKYGDAVAINHYDYKAIKRFKEDLKQHSPEKKFLFLSNGVGYIACDTTERSPPKDSYHRYNDLDQAAMIARTMYTWWDLDTYVAPYYICMRTTIYHSKRSPHWYGFFGFMDLNIDDHDKATITHYPGWHAYRTVANVFYDRDAFTEPQFAIESDPPAAYLKAHERPGKELLIICWGNEKTMIRIASRRFGFPVQIDLLDHEKWQDLPATADSGGVTINDVSLDLAPTIIRLVPVP